MFCLLFHKNFVYFPLSDKNSIANNRITEILEQLGLMNKVWNNRMNCSYQNILSTNINWHLVDRELDKLRYNSIHFLTNALIIR